MENRESGNETKLENNYLRKIFNALVINYREKNIISIKITYMKTDALGFSRNSPYLLRISIFKNCIPPEIPSKFLPPPGIFPFLPSPLDKLFLEKPIGSLKPVNLVNLVKNKK